MLLAYIFLKAFVCMFKKKRDAVEHKKCFLTNDEIVIDYTCFEDIKYSSLLEDFRLI